MIDAMRRPIGWKSQVLGALLVLATALAATGIGLACRRLRPAWLAMAASMVVGGGCGLALGAAVVRLAFPPEAARDFPGVYRFLSAGAAVILMAVGATQAAAVARRGRDDRAKRAGDGGKRTGDEGQMAND